MDGPKWDWADSFLGGAGGFFSGIFAAYGVVKNKVAYTHKRINETNGRIDAVQKELNGHGQDIAVLQSHRDEDRERWDRMEGKLDRLLSGGRGH